MTKPDSTQPEVEIHMTAQMINRLLWYKTIANLEVGGNMDWFDGFLQSLLEKKLKEAQRKAATS